MNMFNLKFFKKALLCATLCISGVIATSCVDDIPEENRFTWTGELISTYLEKNPEQYSSFVTILKKANISKKAQSSLFKTLSTYGSYTCFAPTNDAIYKFLEEQSANPEKTGVYSTDVEQLDDSIATEIAKNHIIEKAYKTIDTPDGPFPKNSMNRRTIELSTVTGALMIDKTSKIIELDIETENGVIQAIDKVLNPSDKKIHEQIIQYKEFRLFGEAIMATGLDEMLDLYKINPEYENLIEDHGGKLESNKYIKKEGKAYAPVERRQRYTVLIEPDELLADENNNHLGIKILTIEDLEKLAQEFYGTEASGDYKNPKNALHQYMLYHIIDRQLFYQGSAPGGFIMENFYVGGKDEAAGFSSETNLPRTFDRCDYFETMLPYTLIKVTRPFTNPALSGELVLNYAQEQGTYCTPGNIGKMEKYMNVCVIEEPEIEDYNYIALNGTIYTINKILVYNEDEMSGNILNERMRWDVSSLFPEMTNNLLRWEENSTNKTTYLPDGYSDRLIVNGVVDNTVILYLRPTESVGLGGYPNYMGDELLALGRYDFKYRIPHVPPGNYEIRFGYSVSNLRAITQFYYDGKVCGIPVDMQLGSRDPLIGWFEEDGLGEDVIKENDKAMRNRGYMKGPASCVLNKNDESMRKSELALRKIVGTFNITKGDHWLRFKNVTENEKKGEDYLQFNQDYLEIVPTSIISNPAKPEDQN